MTARLPNLFLVGAHKAGTTALWTYLGRHREIGTSRVKEPHFFSRFAPPPMWPSIVDADDYVALFKRVDGRYLLDASTSYLWDDCAAEAIARVAPRARILAILRDPLERARSHYWWDRRYGLAPGTFPDALLSDDPGAAGLERPNPYVFRGLYARQLEPYLERFDGRVLVVFFEDFARDPASTMAAVWRFLRVDVTLVEPVEARARNVAAAPRNALARHLLRSPPAWQVARTLVPHRFRSSVKQRLLRPVEKPLLDEATRRALSEWFEPEDERLAALLGRRPPWRLRPAT